MAVRESLINLVARAVFRHRIVLYISGYDGMLRARLSLVERYFNMRRYSLFRKICRVTL